MNATSTEKTDKRQEQDFLSFDEAVASAKMQQATSSDVVPGDTDWHPIITPYRSSINDRKRKQTIPVTRWKVEVGFYTGEFWTRGSSRPCGPIQIDLYDRVVWFPRSRGEITTEGAIRLAGALLASWRKDYLAALEAFRKKRTQKNRATLERLRRECPEWLLPDGMTADFVIMTLDKNIK